MFKTIENFKREMSKMGSQLHMKKHFYKDMKEIEKNPAKIEDDLGRRLRWEIEPEDPPVIKKNCFGCE